MSDDERADGPPGHEASTGGVGPLSRRDDVDSPSGRAPENWIGAVGGLAGMCTILCSLVVGPGSVEWLRRLSIVPGLAGLPLAFVPFYTLSKYGKTVGRSYMSTAVLVDRGPYALVRHPQYLAYILFVIVFVLQAQHPLVAILGSFTALLFHRMAMREERSCTRRFGGAYGDYARRVPRYNLAAGVYRWLRRKSS